MTKKILILSLSILNLCFVTGCFNNNVMNAANVVNKNLESSEGKEFPDCINDTLSSGVKVDATVDIPDNIAQNMSIYQGKILEFDVDKIKKALLGDSIQEYTEQNGEGADAESIRTFSGEDGSQIVSVDDIWMKFSSKRFASIRTDFETENPLNDKKEFDFISENEADAEIKKIFKLLDIFTYSEYECVSMDYETLKEKNLEQYVGLEDIDEFQDDINTLNNIPWSEEYDCYCFTYYGTVDGVKLITQDREINNNVVPGSIIRAVYSKNGIQSLEISNIYMKQEEVARESLCTMDTILSAIDRKYNAIILQGEYVLTSLNLEYIAEPQDNGDGYILLPVWRCSIRHNYDAQDKASSEIISTEDNATIFIDATSGTEIYSGGSI